MRLLLVLSFIQFFAFSQSCPEYNLYNDQYHLSEIPIVDQGRTGMCYAVTASQMMNYQLKKNGSTDTVSAFWLALNHKLNKKAHWNPDSLSFSLLSWSFSDYFKNGHCDQSLAETKLSEIAKQIELSNYNVVETLEMIWDYSRKNSVFDIQKFITYATKRHKTRFVLQPWQVFHLNRVFPTLSKSSSLMSFFKKNFFQHCSNRNERLDLSKDLKKVARSLTSEKKQENKLLSLLSSQNDKPIAIGYCANILKYPGHRIPGRLPGLSLVASKKCYAHYSLIVGSRNNKISKSNQCEVLVRNSYGDKFWADKSYECYCQNRKTSLKYNCNKEQFNALNEKVLGCWLPSLDLAANTFELNHL